MRAIYAYIMSEITAVFTVLIPATGLILNAYSHLSPKAINEKLAATEDLVLRLKRAAASDAIHPEAPPASSLADRYADLLNRAQWANKAGWFWRPLLIGTYVLLLLLATVGQSYRFSVREEGIWNVVAPISFLVIEIALITFVLFGVVKWMQQRSKLDPVSKEEGAAILDKLTEI